MIQYRTARYPEGIDGRSAASSVAAPGHMGLEVIAFLVSRCRSEHAMRGDFILLASMLNKFGLTPRSRAPIESASARMAGKRQRPN